MDRMYQHISLSQYFRTTPSGSMWSSLSLHNRLRGPRNSSRPCRWCRWWSPSRSNIRRHRHRCRPDCTWRTRRSRTEWPDPEVTTTPGNHHEIWEVKVIWADEHGAPPERTDVCRFEICSPQLLNTLPSKLPSLGWSGAILTLQRKPTTWHGKIYILLMHKSQVPDEAHQSIRIVIHII